MIIKSKISSTKRNKNWDFYNGHGEQNGEPKVSRMVTNKNVKNVKKEECAFSLIINFYDKQNRKIDNVNTEKSGKKTSESRINCAADEEKVKSG